jgi:deoxycytidine triphosphate deaminase
MRFNDYDIMTREPDLITPRAAYGVDADGVSFGLDQHGYDARIGTFVALFNEENPDGIAVDHCGSLLLQPGEIVHLFTLEYFNLPRSILGRASAKSYWQRTHHLLVMDGTLKADWRGQLLVEVKNLGFKPVLLQHGQGIIHIAFEDVSPALRGVASQYTDQGVRHVSR